MSPWGELTRAHDGSAAICCVCFEWTDRENLHIDPSDGLPMDICVPCAEDE